jgi:hypothetical protein
MDQKAAQRCQRKKDHRYFNGNLGLGSLRVPGLRSHPVDRRFDGHQRNVAKADILEIFRISLSAASSSKGVVEIS